MDQLNSWSSRLHSDAPIVAENTIYTDALNIELILLGVTSTREIGTRNISQYIAIVNGGEGGKYYKYTLISKQFLSGCITELGISKSSWGFWNREN